MLKSPDRPNRCDRAFFYRLACLTSEGLIWIIIGFLSGCASGPPSHPENLCKIFQERPKWARYANQSYQRWKVPVPVMMAIMYHESSFRADVKPPRTRCLFIFPGPRPSSAYGYAQAVDGTWELYKLKTGNRWASRDSFEDAIDFIGWYCHISKVQCGISKQDAYNLYLAYHQGHGGFNRKYYKKKRWLKRVARSVEKRAGRYRKQLNGCAYFY